MAHLERLPTWLHYSGRQLCAVSGSLNNRQWKPGQTGNPNGRPVGARQHFSNGFLNDLAEVWAAHGKDTMVHTAKLNPEVFFATCARLIPKDVQLTVQQNYSELDETDLTILRAIKDAIPDASNREPGEVLRFRA